MSGWVELLKCRHCREFPLILGGKKQTVIHECDALRQNIKVHGVDSWNTGYGENKNENT